LIRDSQLSRVEDFLQHRYEGGPAIGGLKSGKSSDWRILDSQLSRVASFLKQLNVKS